MAARLETINSALIAASLVSVVVLVNIVHPVPVAPVPVIVIIVEVFLSVIFLCIKGTVVVDRFGNGVPFPVDVVMSVNVFVVFFMMTMVVIVFLVVTPEESGFGSNSVVTVRVSVDFNVVLRDPFLVVSTSSYVQNFNSSFVAVASVTVSLVVTSTNLTRCVAVGVIISVSESRSCYEG